MAKHKPPKMRNSRAGFDAANRRARQQQRESFDIGMQLALDSAFLAAHDVLGLGPGRAKAFLDSFNKYINEVAALCVDGTDSGDTELSYAKTRVDQALQAIEGDVFIPWDERYGR